MKKENGMILFVCLLIGVSSSLSAQNLGSDFTKVKDGIYIRSASESDLRPNAKVLNSNAGIILTQEGVVLIMSRTGNSAWIV